MQRAPFGKEQHSEPWVCRYRPGARDVGEKEGNGSKEVGGKDLESGRLMEEGDLSEESRVRRQIGWVGGG